jgi:short-subunit dehydrogenase
MEAVPMKDLGGKRVLITGAADGIGKAAALEFAREGARLLLVDIDGEKLPPVAAEVRRYGVRCEHFTADVSDPALVESLAAWALEEAGGVDVLLNVAGVCVVADFLETDLVDWDWLIGVNLMGPVYTTRAFLPGMLERGSGHIVNVASAGGLVPLALIPGYCTTKAGLVALSSTLGQEVFSRGVRVTAFCPGITRTGIVGRMRFRGYSRDKILGTVGKMMNRSISTEKTAVLMVDAVRRERPLVVTGLTMKVIVMLNRLFPGLTRFALTRGKTVNDRLYR